MGYKIFGKKFSFKWGESPENLSGSIDVTKEYLNRGGQISPDTEVEFTSTFPPETYKKTALTDHMPDTYECAGSMSTAIHQPNRKTDFMSISDYFDLTGHDKKLGDHHNLYLQYQIGDNKPCHTDEIPHRHIPLANTLYVAAYINDEKVYEDRIKANLS